MRSLHGVWNQNKIWIKWCGRLAKTELTGIIDFLDNAMYLYSVPQILLYVLCTVHKYTMELSLPLQLTYMLRSNENRITNLITYLSFATLNDLRFGFFALSQVAGSQSLISNGWIAVQLSRQ